MRRHDGLFKVREQLGRVAPSGKHGRVLNVDEVRMNLPEIASNFFGSTVSSQQLLGMSRDSIAEEHKEHSGVEGLETAARRLDKKPM